MKRIAIITLALILQGALVHGQLVFPGAEGFGASHRSAYSGSNEPRILIVNSLLDNNEGNEQNGTGTLRWCLTRTYPRIVLFEVGGTIHLESVLDVEHPYLLVAGQSAPSPGIMLTTSTVVVQTHHVLLQHLSFRAGDDPEGSKPESRDCLALYSGACHDITVDHCSMLWGVDENFSVWGGGDPVDNITLSNSILAQGLNYSISPDGAHSKGFLIGYGTRQISVLKNFIAHNDDRNPLMQGGSESELINNLIYNGVRAVSFSNYPEYVTESSVINNLLVQGYDFTENYVARFNAMHPGSSVYLSGNSGTSNDWDYILGNSVGSQVRVDEAPVLSGQVQILSRDQVDTFILKNVGARPWERSAADQQVLDDYENGVGRIVDCVDAEDVRYNAGTAVTATQNTITLDETGYFEDRAYEHKSIEILGGTGAGQRRDVLSYIGGSTRRITVSTDWDIIPDGSSTYTMIVNCGNNAGGWRLLSSSQWTLDIPDDPHGDSNANGYTNLEEWLYALNPIASYDLKELENRYSIYPNPSGGSFTLEFHNSTGMEAHSLQITSLSGAIVELLELDHANLGNTLHLDVSHLQNGIYVVGVQYDDRIVSRKLVLL